MNDRYLFRGKRKDNGEWIEGNLINCDFFNNDGFPIFYILDTDNIEYDCWEDIAVEIGYLEVIPETVGQCTGLKDKNGKLIYEGDVIEAYDEIYVNGFGEVKGKVFFNDGAFAIDVEDVGYIPLYAYGEENIEVIDNIHGGINDSKNSEKD